MWELKFKRKPKPEPEVFEEKQAYIPQTQEHAPSIPRLTDYANRVSKIFNDYCTEMSVQVTIGMNPSDYTRRMYLKVVGNRDVQIDHQGKTYYLAPGESYTFTISDRDCMTGRTEEFLPHLTLMPYGNAGAQQNANLLDKTIPGWSNYKVHQSSALPSPTGLNKQFFRYELP